MVGYSAESHGYGPGRLSLPRSQGPRGTALNDGYHKDSMNNFKGEAPRYNPLNEERPQSSVHVDLKDPIQVHLLTETALTDSKTYEILSQEEVDDLKKQIQASTQRIEQARANLSIQTKYRDAAISMSKLYSPSRQDVDRTHGDDESAREAEQEREEIERKCEELAAELWMLEKRLIEPQRRLLEHTAGVLQLTHKASKKPGQQGLGAPNGIPGSPESMYTFSNGRNSMDPGDDLYFDDNGLYQSLDRGAAGKGSRKTEARLETLNKSLRELLARLNPIKNGNYRAPPSGSDAGHNSGDRIETQLDYLEQGLRNIQGDGDEQSAENLKDAEPTAANASIALSRAEMRIDSLNSQFRNLLTKVDQTYPDPPDSETADLDEQFDYADRSLQLADMELDGAGARGMGGGDAAILTGLWDTIQGGYADIQQRKDERRRMREEQGLEPDDVDMSGDEMDVNEQYSLPAFDSKVRWLFSQATKLKDQKSVLKRQIKQQRELNSKSDSAKDTELQSKQDEVDQTRALLAESEKEAARAQEMLSQALKDGEDASATRSSNETDSKWAQEQLQARDARIATLEAEGRDVQQRMVAVSSSVESMEGKVNESDAEIASLTAKLAEAEKTAQEKQQEAESRTQLAKSKEEELEKLNTDMIEMKTELTIAQAELDGAYGSRKERAQEAAALNSNAEVDKLKSEVERLKDELASTLKELEGVTAETVGAEREKMDVESRLDDALAARAGLETEVTGLRDRLDSETRAARDQVSKLQEELDGERLKAVPSPGGPGGAASRPGAGASMLSEQFRATMKQERKKFQEDLREEQARRRRLEEELQKLRKAQGPGKSPLSPR